MCDCGGSGGDYDINGLQTVYPAQPVLKTDIVVPPGGDIGGGDGGDGRLCSCCMFFWLIITPVSLAMTALGIGIWALVVSISKQQWPEVYGTIIGIDDCGIRNTQGMSEYSATVEYQVADQMYQLIEECSSSNKGTIGNKMRVIYDPNDPSEGFDGSFYGLWLFPMQIIGISLTCCAGAIVTWKQLRTKYM